jgi:hypothetical protein
VVLSTHPFLSSLLARHSSVSAHASSSVVAMLLVVVDKLDDEGRASACVPVSGCVLGQEDEEEGGDVDTMACLYEHEKDVNFILHGNRRRKSECAFQRL